MQTETLLIAIGSPAVLAVLTHLLSRRATRKEWERQDELETRKLAAAEQTARLLLSNNEEVAKTASITNRKLDQIHTLVNSNMTAAMKAELEATVEKLMLMRQLVARDKADKIKVLPEALHAIRMVETKISELTATLNDRLKQTKIAEAALAT